MKQNSILYIDTSSNQEIKVGLRIGQKKFEMRRRIGKEKAQAVLPLIDKLLQKHNLELADLTNIEVNQGPGSFTGLRVGISVVNALGFILKIPVNNKPIVEPLYE